MSREQNIDDILKLLKNSVSTESNITDIDIDPKASQPISEDNLQNRLKDQYLSSSLSPSEGIESEYVIDSEFLNDVKTEIETEVEPETDCKLKDALVIESDQVIEPVKVDCEEDYTLNIDPIADVRIDIDDNDEIENEPENVLSNESLDDNIDELLEGLRPIEDLETYVEDDEVMFEEIDPQGTIDIGSLIEDISDLPNTEASDEVIASVDFENDINEAVAEETLSDTAVDEDVVFESLEVEIESTEPEKQHETFIASMRKIAVDFSSEEKDTVFEDKDEDASQYQSNSAEIENISDDDLDLSTINLMMQFCEKDELKDKIGNTRVEEFLESERNSLDETPSAKEPSEEYTESSQNDKIIENYKRNIRFAMLSMIGCSVLALLSVIIEILPILNIKTKGMFDYVEYPAVYSLIGLQVLVFSAAICYRKLWSGLKMAFSLSPNRHSLVTVTLCMTAVYDLVSVIILSFSHDDIHNTFNSVAAVIVALSCVADYLDIKSEYRAFSVFSSTVNKYTLAKDVSQGGIADKMYLGGLERDKDVYTVQQIDFPNGFFKNQSTKGVSSKYLTISIISVFVLGIIAIVASIILSADAYSATAAFMLSLYAALPISIVFTDSVPYAVVSGSLFKRGSALANKKMVDKYQKCDVMVFGDLHMFKKCNTEDVGIAIYDTSVGYLVLGCLDAIYSKIGGPLSGMQMNLPDVFKFDDVKFRRITRTGIEAVIDRKHVVLVGERSFMQRYGLAFPADEKDSDRSSLCVSLNGKVSAKLSVKYQTEPVFEMLVERLFADGVSCAIATYDPLINSAMISASRTLGSSPVSVIHKNADDYYNEDLDNAREETDGIVSCSSRLKLVEVMIWIKRLFKIKSFSKATLIAFEVIGVISLGLLVFFNLCGKVTFLHLLGFIFAEILLISVFMITKLPPKNYFTTDKLYFELERQEQAQQKNKKARVKKVKQ